MANFTPTSRPISPPQQQFDTSSSRTPGRRTAPAASARQLPNGPCNWRDLNTGHEGNTCGCYQFWLNDAALPSSSMLDRGQLALRTGAWCFCGHHACFHKLRGEHESDGAAALDRLSGNAGAWGLPENFSFGLTHTANATDHCQAAHTAGLPQGSSNGNDKLASNDQAGLGLLMTNSTPQIQQTRPSFLPQPSFIRRADHLPSTQSSPALQSQSTSEGPARPRRSPNTGFAKYVASQRQPLPQVNVQDIPPPINPEELPQSATEVATPSNAGTPALRETDEAFNAVRTTLGAFNRDQLIETKAVPGSQRNSPGQKSDRNPEEHPQAIPRENVSQSLQDQPNTILLTQQLCTQISSLRAILATTPNFNTSLSGLNKRVDALENASFSHAPMEELQDRMECFDGRLLDVEAKIEDIEKIHAQNAKRVSRESKGNESFDSNASSLKSGAELELNHNGMSYSDALTQLSTLEQRLTHLEAISLPTSINPWTIEVIWLPWGRALKGIWTTPREASQASKMETQDSSIRRSSVPGQSSGTQRAIFSSEWADESPSRLSPRACGPTSGITGIVYDRLKSRGFVQTIDLRSNSASNVESAVSSAFSEGLKMAGSTNVASEDDDDAQNTTQSLLGLHAPFIPLRKIHKSSRLRLLGHAELITPSLWTAEFLNSSVFMQMPTTGQRRLFVTTKASYAQDSAYGEGWSWQMLRELPRVFPAAKRDDKGMQGVAEADANEPCWAWDSRLDPPVSANSSFSSGISYHSSLDSHPISPRHTNDDLSEESYELDEEENEEDEDDDCEDQISAEEHSENRENAKAQPPITPISDFPLSRQSQRHRTASMPLTELQASQTVSIPKRQISSFEQHSPAKGTQKRRRFSRSPDDVELMAMWSLTPRRSREPPSPGSRHSAHRSTTYDARHVEVLQASSGRSRWTPQPYATPFSNEIVIDANDTDVMSDGGSSLDADEDDEDDDASIEMNDDAWEGVDDDDQHAHVDRDDEDDEAAKEEDDVYDGDEDELAD